MNDGKLYKVKLPFSGTNASLGQKKNSSSHYQRRNYLYMVIYSQPKIGSYSFFFLSLKNILDKVDSTKDQAAQFTIKRARLCMQ